MTECEAATTFQPHEFDRDITIRLLQAEDKTVEIADLGLRGVLLGSLNELEAISDRLFTAYDTFGQYDEILWRRLDNLSLCFWHCADRTEEPTELLFAALDVLAEDVRRDCPVDVQRVIAALRDRADRLDEIRQNMSVTARFSCFDCGRLWKTTMTVRDERNRNPDNCPDCFNSSYPDRKRKSSITVWQYLNENEIAHWRKETGQDD